MDCTCEQVAKMIDHSLLNPVLTDTELEEGCRIARHYDVASVCIKPYALRRCAEMLAGCSVQPSTTIGFPHGGHATALKVAETERAAADGGTELDMVVNIGKVLSGDWGYVRDDIRAVIEASHAHRAIVKVIFENAYLQGEQKIKLCEICAELGADFVKTSTGYGPGGSTTEDLRLMRKHTPPHIQVKAAGGIRNLDQLLAVRKLGVTRVGATRTAEMMDECRRRVAAGGR